MKKELKAILESIDHKIYFVDESGNRIEPEEALKKGLMIRPVDGKKNALEAVKNLTNLNLEDPSEVNILMEIVDKLSNKKSGKRTTFSEEEKNNIVAEFKASGLSKSNFAKSKGLKYQTFINWL
jgi:transcriptional regulator with PAS, ATPase and Fis domain